MEQLFLSLNGDWQFREAGTKEWMAGRVPGDVNYDLFVNGRRGDYLSGMGYREYSDVAGKDWEYRKDFTVTDAMLAAERLVLHFKGIDTFADVYVNGTHVLAANDMFLDYRVEIGKAVRPGKNTLRVALRSVLAEMEKYHNKRYVSIFNRNRIFIRKAQCHFGWDWAPNLPGYGIWQDAEIIGEDEDRIEDVYIAADAAGNVSVQTELSYSSYFQDEAADDELEVALDDGEKASALPLRRGVDGKRAVFNLRLDTPRLWWPNGYGEQNFYFVTVRLFRSGRIKDEVRQRFALRQVQLLQDALDGGRNRCRLAVNGVEIFCKGSNWVPADCFAGTMPNEKYTVLIELARRANFNMLRVWGGGFYEKEAFYDACDEAGILVWQDFMFACCDAPNDSLEYQNLVVRETEQAVMRLRRHPCIALWCGGNEWKGALDPCSEPVYGKEMKDYFLRGIAAHLTPDIPYVSGSPFGFAEVANGMESGDTHTNCSEESVLRGDMRSYRDVLAKNRAMFFSECAVLGPCRYRSLKKFIPEEKLWPLNELYDDRFVGNPYSPCPLTFAGREQLAAQQLFGNVSSAAEFCHKGMQAHYEILRSEIENARTTDCCGGFLNWMYNDIWPNGTWSVVDYYLEPKSAYYAMKDAFRPLHLCYRRNADGSWSLMLVNDTAKSVSGRAEYGRKQLNGAVLHRQSKAACAPPYSLTEVERFSHVPQETDSYLYAAFSGGGESIRTTYFPYLWDCKFASEYETRFSELSEGLYAVDVRAGQYTRAFSVTLRDEGKRAYFSDNYFDLEAGETRRVKIECDARLTEQDLLYGDFTVVSEL